MQTWYFPVRVECANGTFVETELEYECSEETYARLAEAKDNKVVLSLSSELLDIYEEACNLAYEQEWAKFVNKTEYDFVEDFDMECLVYVFL